MLIVAGVAGADASLPKSTALIRPGADCSQRRQQSFAPGRSRMDIAVPSTKGIPAKMLSVIVSDALVGVGAPPLEMTLYDRARRLAVSRKQCIAQPSDGGARQHCWVELGFSISRDREGQLALIVENHGSETLFEEMRVCVFDPFE
jgi:hypothetical protein